MPDPTHQTISASTAAALFNTSPYVTHWMLYQNFAKGMNIEEEADNRMTMGTLIEPIILAKSADDLKLEVRTNRAPDGTQRYYRRGLLGCHRDGDIICPDRGPGAIEAKCCFDGRTWMSNWHEGKAPPKHVEVQLQVQMYVGDGRTPYQWGVVAAFFAGDVKYFERKPSPKLWDALEKKAEEFFRRVKDGDAPDPFGVQIEESLLNELFPVDLGKEIEVDDKAFIEVVIQYKAAKEQEAAGKRTKDNLRPKILALAKDANRIVLPDGIRVSIKPHGSGKRIDVYVPGEI